MHHNTLLFFVPYFHCMNIWYKLDYILLLTVLMLGIYTCQLLGEVSYFSATVDLRCLHQVPEGHAGVYWRGGALLSAITEPGFYHIFFYLNLFCYMEFAVYVLILN